MKQTGKNTGKNIEEIDFGLYQRHREAIIKVARDIGKLQAQDYSKELHLLLEELAGKVTDRTMGIIRHSIIAPVMMPAVSFSTEVLSKHLMEFSSKGKISGVSAGDSFEVDEKGKEEKKEANLDAQLQNLIEDFVKANPKYAKEIKTIGYVELKKQLIETAMESQFSRTNVITELFGISEAKAHPAAILGRAIAPEIIKWGGRGLISILLAEKTSETFRNIEFEKETSLPLSISSNNEDESGICKESHPYLLEDDRFITKENWMHKPNVSFKDKQLLEGVKLYGVNPNEVGIGKKGILKVNTELPGGEFAARECFKNLTGKNAPLILIEGKEIFPKFNGYNIILRTPDSSSSGHWKVEIHAPTQHEKITFKDL